MAKTQLIRRFVRGVKKTTRKVQRYYGVGRYGKRSTAKRTARIRGRIDTAVGRAKRFNPFPEVYEAQGIVSRRAVSSGAASMRKRHRVRRGVSGIALGGFAAGGGLALAPPKKRSAARRRRS